MKQSEDWHLTEGLGQEHGRGDPFAAAMRGTRMPMVITDPRQNDNPIVFVNEAFQQLTQYDRAEIIGRNCRFLQGPDSNPDSVTKVRDAIKAGKSLNVDLLNYRKDGTTFWNALFISPVRGDTGEIQFFFASQLDVSDRIEAQRVIAEQKSLVDAEVVRRTADLNAALEAKTVLLTEVDHRVKNNLAMIGSLLRLQARNLRDPALTDTLNRMLERVDALSAVHRTLYQSGDVTVFDVGSFASSLVKDVVGASGRDNIRLEIISPSTFIPAEQATPLGLILNELVTNAIKHAFAAGRGGALKLNVRQDDKTTTVLLSDDGPGFDQSAVSSGSLGRSLVDRMARQIKAIVVWDGVAPGTDVTITVPRKDVSDV